jgi:long-subunit fatty acid transport protein
MWGATLLLAAALGIPDLGAPALGQAGATVARPNDLTALYYNPGALAFLEGVQLYADVRAIDQHITFQRLDSAGLNPQNWSSISNSGGPAISPILAASWHHGPFTLALGGHPFPGATGFEYPDPQVNANPRLTPQRYLSIESHNKIYVPVLAGAMQVLPWLGVGAGLQLPVAYFDTRQSVYAGPVAGEFPDFDANLTLSGHQWFAVSGVFGVSAQPLPWLQAGAAFQLRTKFSAQATIDATLPQATQNLGLTVTGNRAVIDVMFPWVLRGGVRFVQPAWSVELAGTFEKWSMLKRITVTPEDISIQLGGSQLALPQFVLEKDLQDAGSVRLGGEWHVKPWLTLRAGALYETNAIPEDRQSLDWLSWQRFSLNAGVGMTFGNLEVSLSGARFVQADRDVRDSQLHQLTAFPVAGTIIGDGNFQTSLTVAAMSISYRSP